MNVDQARSLDQGDAPAFSIAGVDDDLGFPPRVPVAKRIFDVVIAVSGLLFALPLMAVIGLTILLRDGRPILFAQERVGHGGRTFRCLKFRTMAVDSDARLARLLAECPAAREEWRATRKLQDDPRVTAIGAVLRKTSLDELPQFWNVLRGDMSVVGPRPIVADEAVYYREHFLEYKAVRPGLTGVWQVNGRSDTTYEERVAMDVGYVRGWSFWRDLAITVQTVMVVVEGKGAR